MLNDTNRAMCLIDELDTAQKLIILGLGELQEIHIGNDFYHLPQQLLASGYERLLKCYFCLVHQARRGHYPDRRFFKNLSHDLRSLHKSLMNDYFSTNEIPLLCEDLTFLKEDACLEKTIGILSDFGEKGRYYNLDIVAGIQKPLIDPKAEWEALERSLENPEPYLATNSIEDLHRDYYPRVNAKIIARLERFARAIAMQFTLGRHGGNLKQMSSSVSCFITLRDSDFGTIDYRRSVKAAQRSKDKWHKREKHCVLDGPWPSRLITKNQFSGDWPFRTDEVVIECREKTFCVVNIEDYDFALNGTSRSRFDYPFPHDVGMAIIGKSVGPFIDMAFSLSMSRDTESAT